MRAAYTDSDTFVGIDEMLVLEFDAPSSIEEHVGVFFGKYICIPIILFASYLVLRRTKHGCKYVGVYF